MDGLQINAIAYVRNGAPAIVHVGASLMGRRTTIDRLTPGAIGYERGMTAADLDDDPFIATADALIVEDPETGELSVATGPTNMPVVRIAWIAPIDWPDMAHDGDPVFTSVAVEDLTRVIAPDGTPDLSGTKIFETLFTPLDEIIPRLWL